MAKKEMETQKKTEMSTSYLGLIQLTNRFLCQVVLPLNSICANPEDMGVGSDR